MDYRPGLLIHSRGAMEQIIVRRGKFLTFELLKRTFADDPNVQIIWDRRRLDNPPPKAEVSERRSLPPAEWDRLDYFFASGRRPNRPGSAPKES
jgi:hypothetical protein